MKFIGFNLTKVSAEKSPDFKLPVGVKPNVEITNLDKQKIDFLNDLEALKVDFSYSIIYHTTEGKKEQQLAEILFKGHILFAPEEEDLKNILKLWKKKEILPENNLMFINIILKRCSVKALVLEEELNLPPYPQLPRAQLGNK